MEIFQLTLFFMFVFFVVIALLVHRNQRSTVHVSYEGTDYWLLCSELQANEKAKLIAYLESPGFTFGPYVWVIVETDSQGKLLSLTEEIDEF